MSAAPASPGALSALADACGRHRLLLFAVYAGFMTVCLFVAYKLGLFLAPDAISFIVPDRERVAGSFLFEFPEELDEPAYFLAGLLLLQALFLFGGGRIPIGRNRARAWRILIPIVITTAAGLAIIVTLAGTFLEMFDRLHDSDVSIRNNALLPFSDYLNDGIAPALLGVLAVVWLVWIAVAVAFYRRRDQASVIRRLVLLLLAGSWVEFLVALPVDIAVRQRAEDCPCATGSWFALLVAVPVMLFAFGPALFLLYLREVELGRSEPRRAARILLHKSRLERRAGEADPDE